MRFAPAATAALGLLAGCDARVPAWAAEGDSPSVIASRPADGDEDVERRLVLRARFDRALDPDTVHRGSVRLDSGAQSVFLSLLVDPVERALVAMPFRGALLEPEVVYRWRLEGVRDLAGRSMDPWESRFRTGRARGEPLSPASPPPWSEVGALLRSRCATAQGCHGSGTPVLGLDLSGAEGVQRTALGVPARQVTPATTGGGGAVSGAGLVGMAIVDVLGGQGRPEASYLMYKVLGDPHVVGEPMPPDEELTADDKKVLSLWIRYGAPLE